MGDFTIYNNVDNLEDIMLSGRGNWRKVVRKYKLKINRY